LGPDLPLRPASFLPELSTTTWHATHCFLKARPPKAEPSFDLTPSDCTDVEIKKATRADKIDLITAFHYKFTVSSSALLPSHNLQKKTLNNLSYSP
jgi:hypothetical protein